MSNIETYGLTEQDLLGVQWKIAKQKKYMESQTFIGEDNKVKSLLDVSYSANLSERFYPRILNKVDTFVSTSLGLDLVPVFLTVTADGFFRRMMRGDYSEWTDDLREKYLKHIPNNKRNGFYLDYMDKHSTLTPKDIYKILGYQLHRFYKCETLRAIKKAGHIYTSIRVTEPHKDGVPHFHILMYLPVQYVPRLYREFMRFFPAPRNHRKITYKNTTGKHRRNGHYVCDIDGKKMYETFGFQTQIRSAAAYILKYILKSFRNLIEGNEIDYLQAWYVHNKIPRIISTHTLVSQDIYHKSSLLEDDWYYLTSIKLDGNLKMDRLNNYFKFNDGMGRTIMHDNGYFILSNAGRIISTYGSKEFHIKKIRLRSLNFTIFADLKPPTFNILDRYEIYTPHKEYSYYISRSYDDCTFFSFGSVDDFFIESGVTSDLEFSLSVINDYLLFGDYFSHKSPTLSDQSLFDSYHNFDFDVDNPQRWAYFHNEMFDRGLLSEDKVNINLYASGVLNDW